MLTGYVSIQTFGLEGLEEVVVFEGPEFSLEEGGDWSEKDGAHSAGYLFKAFGEEIDVVLSLSVSDRNVAYYDLSCQITNPGGLKEAKVLVDNIDVSHCFWPS